MSVRPSPVDDFDPPHSSPKQVDCGYVPGLYQRLREQEYQPLPTANGAEYGRLQRQASLVVLFKSGNVVFEGGDVSSAVALVSQYIMER